jgi:orotidine-5'-phosphate decarboxylase
MVKAAQSADPRDQLIVALDAPTAAEARALVTALGDAVTFYKVGHELLFSGGLELARALKSEGKRVFLDMKLLDIGNTMERSVANAATMGVDFLTIHGHDSKTIAAAVAGRGASNLKLLAVTVLTNLTADDLAEQGHTRSPAELVLHRAGLTKAARCDGVIASGQEAASIRQACGPDFLIVTPGIRLPDDAAGDQSRVMTPTAAKLAGANHIVVGRPITNTPDPRAAALKFQQLLVS